MMVLDSMSNGFWCAGIVLPLSPVVAKVIAISVLLGDLTAWGEMLDRVENAWASSELSS